MNPLATSQLLELAINIIGDSSNHSVKHNIVEQVKLGLQQLVESVKQQHAQQLKEQLEVGKQIEQPSNCEQVNTKDSA
jgi:hypothetical protein